jgi:hypothetical protein
MEMEEEMEEMEGKEGEGRRGMHRIFSFVLCMHCSHRTRSFCEAGLSLVTHKRVSLEWGFHFCLLAASLRIILLQYVLFICRLWKRNIVQGCDMFLYNGVRLRPFFRLTGQEVLVQTQDLGKARSSTTVAHACGGGDRQPITVRRDTLHLLLSPQLLHEQGLSLDYIGVLLATVRGRRRGGSTLVE